MTREKAKRLIQYIQGRMQGVSQAEVDAAIHEEPVVTVGPPVIVMDVDMSEEEERDHELSTL